MVGFTFVKFLAIAIQREWKVTQLYFDNAFTNGKLDREVYAQVTKHGHVEDVGNSSCLRLNKSLYGLREASGIWFQLLSEKLTAFGLHEMRHVPCVYITGDMVVLNYVDDVMSKRRVVYKKNGQNAY